MAKLLPHKTMPINDLKSLIDYDPATGHMYWKYRPGVSSRWNVRYPGKRALIRYDNEGYLCGKVRQKHFRAHRVAWALHYGKWPDGVIDHINGIKDDNRIENLRVVSRAQNGRNRKLSANNKTGFNGVIKQRSGRFAGQIRCRGKVYYLGVFPSAEEAGAAVSRKANSLGFDRNHGART